MNDFDRSGKAGSRSPVMKEKRADFAKFRPFLLDN